MPSYWLHFLPLPGVHANLEPDADLAALVMGHGLTLCRPTAISLAFSACAI